MMTTVDEVNNDKTKVPDEFVSLSVSLVCFTADVHVSLLIKLCMQNEHLCLWFYVLIRYSVVLFVQLWNYAEKTIPLKLSKHWWIFNDTELRWIFTMFTEPSVNSCLLPYKLWSNKNFSYFKAMNWLEVRDASLNSSIKRSPCSTTERWFELEHVTESLIKPLSLFVHQSITLTSYEAQFALS